MCVCVCVLVCVCGKKHKGRKERSRKFVSLCSALIIRIIKLLTVLLLEQIMNINTYYFPLFSLCLCQSVSLSLSLSLYIYIYTSVLRDKCGLTDA